MSDIAYFAADTLGMTLYAIKNGLESSEIRPIRLGPWQVDLSVDAKSDLITGNGISFWLKVASTLRLYLIVREKESQMLVLDSEALKLCGAASSFESETIAGRLQEIGPAVKAHFTWMDGHWTKAKV